MTKKKNAYDAEDLGKIAENIGGLVEPHKESWQIVLLAFEASLGASRKIIKQLDNDPKDFEIDPIYEAHVHEVMGALVALVSNTGPEETTRAIMILANLLASWMTTRPDSKATNYFRATLQLALDELNISVDNPVIKPEKNEK